ncbi:G-type lectin S-receptor-like serine/threonine-protein kinase SD2-5 [Macadamia integrifolia]|uniref:G-type lectin S-receptor-like serine/threonine-protein kinase SD2-5 n=1 Tax=Macadamia integrifolia TaxID=60698 RepID=UPI001C4FE4D7|nr:G-type lectin S-receptor-like serine/threonine-protein kinase SD2-5 [Macadamia integrifolia]
MEFYQLTLTLLLFFFFTVCASKSDIPIGYRVTVPVPSEFNEGFKGKAFFMEIGNGEPDFRAAVTVEAMNNLKRYSCSLQVFLGDTIVWSSSHFSPFYPSQRCVLELTKGGELLLMGGRRRVGWRTNSSGQGVERFQLLITGNLVLTDAMNNIKWQSFDFPTDVMLWSQVLKASARLTSFSTNSSELNSYSLEVRNNKIALYLNSGSWKYSYWEFGPSRNQNITFAELGSAGLKLFNVRHRKIAQISPSRHEPVRFLALNNKTGNLGLYYYSADKRKFEASYQALNRTCDLPQACKPYSICNTPSNSCTCIEISGSREDLSPSLGSECSKGFPSEFCNASTGPVEMVELNGISSNLRSNNQIYNISKESCSSSCLANCSCVAALYSAGGCFLYGLVSGLKQVDRGDGMSYYLVKVPKGIRNSRRKSRLKNLLLVMGGILDGLVLFVLGGFAFYYFVIRKRRKDSSGNDST